MSSTPRKPPGTQWLGLDSTLVAFCASAANVEMLAQCGSDLKTGTTVRLLLGFVFFEPPPAAAPVDGRSPRAATFCLVVVDALLETFPEPCFLRPEEDSFALLSDEEPLSFLLLLLPPSAAALAARFSAFDSCVARASFEASSWRTMPSSSDPRS